MKDARICEGGRSPTEAIRLLTKSSENPMILVLCHFKNKEAKIIKRPQLPTKNDIPESGTGQLFQATYQPILCGDHHLPATDKSFIEPDQLFVPNRNKTASTEMRAAGPEMPMARLEKEVAHSKMELAHNELLDKCPELVNKCVELPVARLVEEVAHSKMELAHTKLLDKCPELLYMSG